MKFNILYTIFGLSVLAFTFMSNSGGRASSQNAGNTGAPGEQTCQQCHNGGAFNVSLNVEVFETGTTTPITAYIPGTTYDVKITNTASGSPAGFGFQAVSLIDDGDADVAGWSDPSSNTKIATATGRQYVEHNGINSNGIYNAKWTAPASGSGAVTFYAAGTAVNGTGNSAGDGASGGATLSLSEDAGSSAYGVNNLKMSLKAYPNPVTDFLNVEIVSEQSGAYALQILDMNGRLVQSENIDLTAGKQSNIVDVTSMSAGMYLLQMNNGQQTTGLKFIKK